jgi:hypothetical protein
MSIYSSPSLSQDTFNLKPLSASPSYGLSLNQENRPLEEQPTCSQCSWSGHVVNFSAAAVELVTYKVIGAIQTVFNCSALVVEDSNILACFFRKLDRHILTMFEHVIQLRSDHFKRVGESLKSMLGVIDFVQVAVDIDYFIRGRFNVDSKITVLGKISLAFSDLGYAILWLEEMGFFTLSKAATALGNVRLFSFVPALISNITPLRHMSGLQQAAASIGNVRVFSFLNKISFEFIALRALTLAYAFFAVDAIQKLIESVKTKDKVSIINSSLECLYLISELALDGLLFAGVSHPLGLGLAATTCVTLAIGSLIYKHFNKSEKDVKINLLEINKKN